MMNSNISFGAVTCRRAALLLALATAFCSAGAASAKTASASLKAVISFTLTDLAPDDGIAPSYTVINPDWNSYDIRIEDKADGSFVHESNDGTQPLSASSVKGLDKASVSISGDFFKDRFASIEASTYITEQDGDAGFQIAYASLSNMAYLSPHTSITYHVDYEMTAAASGLAWSDLALSTINFTSNDVPYQYFSLGHEQGAATGSWSFTADNVGDIPLLKRVEFETRAYGVFTGLVPEVPEPATYGMILAGLGVVALTARRRKAA